MDRHYDRGYTFTILVSRPICIRMYQNLRRVNSIIKRPKLAKTFEILAREGESAFYNGSLTDTIVHEIQTNGGIITRQDLQSYECQVKEPLTYSLKSNVLLNTVPSPSCGSLLNFILAILDCNIFKNLINKNS